MNVHPLGRSPYHLVDADAAAPSVVPPYRSQSNAHDWLLLLRFVLTNAFALTVLVAAWLVGHVDMVLAADSSRLSVVIASVFVFGWAFAWRAAVLISRDLNRVRRGDPRIQPHWAINLETRLQGRIAVVRQTASTLVLLGLIGTVIGFIIALSGVNPEGSGDPSAIAPMIATMIRGMSVALYTTLVGSVLALWLVVLHRILATAGGKLLGAVRAAGHA